MVSEDLTSWLSVIFLPVKKKERLAHPKVVHTQKSLGLVKCELLCFMPPCLRSSNMGTFGSFKICFCKLHMFPCRLLASDSYKVQKKGGGNVPPILHQQLKIPSLFRGTWSSILTFASCPCMLIQETKYQTDCGWCWQCGLSCHVASRLSLPILVYWIYCLPILSAGALGMTTNYVALQPLWSSRGTVKC